MPPRLRARPARLDRDVGALVPLLVGGGREQFQHGDPVSTTALRRDMTGGHKHGHPSEFSGIELRISRSSW